MAYASKYYDPAKAHEYYMRTRELKGYEDRYGGSRGNGTSAASTGASVSGTLRRSSGRSNTGASVSGTLGSSNGRSNTGVSVSGTLGSSNGRSSQNNNQKSKEAVMHIKNQIEKERNEIIKKTNKDCDKEMLDSVKRLASDIKAMRESGSGFSHKQFAARIKAMLGETKKKKIKAKRKYTADYKQKYKDEIDKLRSDKSMYSYYDKKAE